MNTRAVRAILRLIGDADSAPSVDVYRTELLIALACAVPSELVVWNEFRIDGSYRPPIGSSEPREGISPALQAAFAARMLEHPLVRHYAAGDHSAHRLSDATGSRAFHNVGLYREFFRPLGIEYQLTLGLTGPTGWLVGISLNRSGRDFTDEELLLAELLRPHLQAGEMALARACAHAPRA